MPSLCHPQAVRLRVVGYETIGSVGHVAELTRRAEQLRVVDRIEFLPALPRVDLFPVCRRSHVGLGLMPLTGGDLNMTHMIGASNKIFDYLSQGMPVLVSNLPAWRVEYVDSGLGLACDK